MTAKMTAMNAHRAALCCCLSIAAAMMGNSLCVPSLNSTRGQIVACGGTGDKQDAAGPQPFVGPMPMASQGEEEGEKPIQKSSEKANAQPKQDAVKESSKKVEQQGQEVGEEPEPEPEPEEEHAEESDPKQEEVAYEGETTCDDDAPRDVWLESSGYANNQPLAQSYIDAGCLIEYPERWYGAHWYTGWGEQIASLRVGDIVHVDGLEIMICGSFDVNYHLNTCEDVRAAYPTEYLFATCYGDGSGWEKISYGYPV